MSPYYLSCHAFIMLIFQLPFYGFILIRFKDKKFIEECTEEYLQTRSEYRRTGISQKQKKKESATF